MDAVFTQRGQQVIEEIPAHGHHAEAALLVEGDVLQAGVGRPGIELRPRAAVRWAGSDSEIVYVATLEMARRRDTAQP